MLYLKNSSQMAVSGKCATITVIPFELSFDVNISVCGSSFTAVGSTETKCHLCLLNYRLVEQ